MQSANAGYRRNKNKNGGQQTLFGGRAFDPLKDCVVCKGRASGRNPHRPHHERCPHNRKTKGITSKATIESLEQEKRLLKHFQTPLAAHEKGSLRHLTEENVKEFFQPRSKTSASTDNPPVPVAAESTVSQSSSKINFFKAVVRKLKDSAFVYEHSNNKAPLAMIAAAAVAMETVVRPNGGALIKSFFEGLTMTIPEIPDCNNPHYHSIAGQKLLLVDWKKMMGLDVLCPCCKTLPLRNDSYNVW